MTAVMGKLFVTVIEGEFLVQFVEGEKNSRERRNYFVFDHNKVCTLGSP